MTSFTVAGYLAPAQDGRGCLSLQALTCDVCGVLVIAGGSQRLHLRWHEQDPD